jgi:CheY-like chemotaxis protein
MVLVVDDEAEVRRFVRSVLEQAGYAVAEAANAEEAWRILEQDQPELLLTDIVMPGATGLQLAARAHKLRPQLRAIFMTGYAEQYRDELSGSVCLSKPFTVAALISAVESAIGHPRPKTRTGPEA